MVLVRLGPTTRERRLLACRNIQDELHAKDPERFPRTARTAYYIAHEDLLEIGRRESEGFEVQVIYHSHVDAGAYFSETDRRNAMIDGAPAYPHRDLRGRGGDPGAAWRRPARIASSAERPASSWRSRSSWASARSEQKAVDGSGTRCYHPPAL